MKLVILGSGTSLPHARRAAPGHWLETDSGYVLLDASVDVSHRMAAEGLPWTDLDAVWISHLHLDHCGGLAPFLFGTRNAPQLQERKRPLKICGAAGIGRLIDVIDQSNNYRLLSQPFPVEVVEVSGGTTFEMLPGLEAEVFSTPHTKESLAIRIKDKSGSVFVYTSDTGYSDELASFARGADLLLMECSFHKNKPVTIHLELTDAMKIASACSPRMLVLTHLYFEWDGVDLAGEARKLWPGETIEAFDGLRLTL